MTYRRGATALVRAHVQQAPAGAEVKMVDLLAKWSNRGIKRRTLYYALNTLVNEGRLERVQPGEVWRKPLSPMQVEVPECYATTPNTGAALNLALKDIVPAGEKFAETVKRVTGGTTLELTPTSPRYPEQPYPVTVAEAVEVGIARAFRKAGLTARNGTEFKRTTSWRLKDASGNVSVLIATDDDEVNDEDDVQELARQHPLFTDHPEWGWSLIRCDEVRTTLELD